MSEEDREAPSGLSAGETERDSRGDVASGPRTGVDGRGQDDASSRSIDDAAMDQQPGAGTGAMKQ